MTKEEYLSRVASIRREMCEQIVAVTSEYIRESPGKVDELDADGIRLIRKDTYITSSKWNFVKPVKGGKELTLFFSAILEASFPGA